MILIERRYGLAGLLCCVLASVAGGAEAQAPGVGPPVEAPPATAADATVAPPPTTAAEAAEPAFEESVEAPAPVASAAGNRAELERRLHALEAERAERSNFWPLLLVGTGAVMTLTGTVVGVGATFECEGETCSSPAWATLFVVVGIAIGSASAVWLVRSDAATRELDIQTKRVRMDLEQLDHVRLTRARGFAKLATPPLNVRLSF